ncbi:MAG: RNA-dependent RNA polymerase [Sanya lschnura senegalensis phenuivirus 1]|nr:MAG: RNA-dependent RNA polymerase [Sanya lschnura senegalensis phenuivirus 1]
MSDFEMNLKYGYQYRPPEITTRRPDLQYHGVNVDHNSKSYVYDVFDLILNLQRGGDYLRKIAIKFLKKLGFQSLSESKILENLYTSYHEDIIWIFTVIFDIDIGIVESNVLKMFRSKPKQEATLYLEKNGSFINVQRHYDAPRVRARKRWEIKVIGPNVNMNPLDETKKVMIFSLMVTEGVTIYSKAQNSLRSSLIELVNDGDIHIFEDLMTAAIGDRMEDICNFFHVSYVLYSVIERKKHSLVTIYEGSYYNNEADFRANYNVIKLGVNGYITTKISDFGMLTMYQTGNNSPDLYTVVIGYLIRVGSIREPLGFIEEFKVWALENYRVNPESISMRQKIMLLSIYCKIRVKVVTKISYHAKRYNCKVEFDVGLRDSIKILSLMIHRKTIFEMTASEELRLLETEYHLNPTNKDTVIEHSSIRDNFQDEAIDRFLNESPISDYVFPDMEVYRITQNAIGATFKYTGFDVNTGRHSWDVDGSHSLIRESVISRTDEEMKNFVHDFTFQVLVERTDVSFKEVGMGLGDADDNKTPDYIKIDKKGKKWFVVEFTTRRSQLDKTRLLASFGKEMKYESAIKSRCLASKFKAIYYIIVVSPQAISTNLRGIDDELVDLLCARYRFALALSDSFNGERRGELETKDLSAQEYKITRILDRLSFDYIIDGKKSPILNEHISIEQIKNIVRPHHHADTIAVRDLLQKVSNDATNKTLDPLTLSDGETIFDKYLDVKMLNYTQRKETYTKQINEFASRIDSKAVVQLPMLIPKQTIPADNSLDTIHSYFQDAVEYTYHATYMTWFKCLRDGKIEVDPDFVSEVDRLGLSMDCQNKVDEDQKSKRRKYGRFKYLIGEDLKVELAKIGIDGKRYKNNLDVSSYRSEKKRPFSLCAPTDDILDFIHKDHSLHKPFPGEIDTRTESVLNLINQSLKVHHAFNVKHVSPLTLEYLKSKMGVFCKFISDLSTEICVSLKQSCNSNEIIIKKLLHFDAYLAIKPTSLSKKIFYSIGWFKSDNKIDLMNTTFKKYDDLGGFCVTEYVSATVSKLTNLVRAEAMGLSLLSFWLEQYNIPVENDFNLEKAIEDNPDVLKMWKWTMLIFLNDKHGAEEIITLSRFIHMEALVSFPNVSDPSKMFEKLPIVLRSRLEVLLVKQMMKLMKSYCLQMRPPSITSKSRTWNGFLNPFLDVDDESLKMCSGQDFMLSLCYLGYLKNKDEDPESNSSGQMLTKIVGWEKDLPKTDEFLGEKNPKYESIGKHEFNVSLIKEMCKLGLDHITSTTGDNNPKVVLARECLHNLCYQFLDTFATLKASSEYNEDWYEYDVKTKQYHRSKVIEKIAAIVSKKDPLADIKLVFDLLEEALNHLEQNKILHVCIFKKNQHGGLREIYVLDIYGRIVQKCLEDLSRTILSKFDNETMTHPKNKFIIPENVNKQSYSNYSGNYRTFCSSDDAAKWNQGHYVVKFMIMLCSLLPDQFHGLIIRGMQLWLKKRIKIGDDLLQIFQNNDNLHTTDSVLLDIFLAYKGRKELSWVDKNKTYIQTRSGMMQGILHYTSSLYHTLLLLLYKDWVKKTLDHFLISLKLQPCIVETMQSSDDSSVMISVPTSSEKDNFQISILVLTCLHAKEFLSKQAGIYKSVKSTTFTEFVMEFNSEFFFFGDVHRPTFRWVNASLIMTEQENLTGRQEELYSLITSILSGGGTMMLSHYCQIAQSLLHYRLLGCSVSVLWPLYANLLSQDMDPALGFFLFDHQMFAGIPGFNYNVWKYCKMSKLGVKYKQILEHELLNEDKKLKEITPETIGLGILSRTTTVSFSSSTRWQSIMAKISLEDNWKEIVDSEPEVLYFKPKNALQLLIKLGVKMMSPGVVESLGKNNVVSRVIASSVYILSRPVLYTRSRFCLVNIKNKPYKISLTMDLISSLVSMNNYLEQAKMSDLSVYNIREKIHQNHLISEWRIMTSEPEMEICKFMNKRMRPKVNFELDFAGYKAYCNLTEQGLGYRSFGNISKYYQVSAITVDRYDDEYYIIRDRYLPDSNIYPLVFYYNSSRNELNIFSCDVDKNFIDMSILDSDKLSDVQESILFPFKTDYETILSCQNSMHLHPAIKGLNYRRRKRSDLIVSGTEMTGIYQPEKVLMWKWFGVNQLSMSPDTMEDLYIGIKDGLPWIREEIQNTLKTSPFTNHIQLQNFLSRLDKSGRVVHLIGSYANMRMSVTTLSTLIKKNYSNGFVFEDTTDELSKIKSHDTSIYFHLLCLLSKFPLLQQKKDQLVYKMLRECPEVKVSKSPNSKRTRLSLIQDFCLGCPDLHFSMSTDVIGNRAIKLKKIGRNPIPSNKEMSELSSKILSTTPDDCDFMDQYLIDEAYKISEMVGEAMEVWLDDDEDYHEWRESRINQLISISEEENKLLDTIQNTSAQQMYIEGKVNSMDDLDRIRVDFKKQLPKIANQIRSLHLGMFGYYSEPQKYDPRRKKYIGEGTWVGVFDATSVKITIFSDENSPVELMSVSLSASKNMKTMFEHIKDWCRDNNVQNTNNFKKNREGKIAYCHISAYKESTSEKSCPIFIIPTLVTELNFKFNKFSIELTNYSLRLKGHYRSDDDLISDRFVTLIQVSLGSWLVQENIKDFDLNQFTTLNFMPSFLKDWLLWTSNNRHLEPLIMNMDDDQQLHRVGVIPSDFKVLLREMWMARCQRVIGSALSTNRPVRLVQDSKSESKVVFNKEAYDSITKMASSKLNDLLEQAISITVSNAFLELIQSYEHHVEIEKDPQNIITKVHPNINDLLIGDLDLMKIHSSYLDSKSSHVVLDEDKVAIKRFLEVVYEVPVIIQSNKLELNRDLPDDTWDVI